MVKNYILIAFRNIIRSKLFSTVNIMGLAFGMSSALLIFLWVNDEISYNRFHPNVDRLYRVMENQHYTDGRIFTFSATPGPMAPFIKDKFPEIEKATRLTWDIDNLFKYEDKSFYESGKYADQDFLEMFGFTWMAGDITTALADKSSIVITEKIAVKYFGKEDPIGKVLSLNADASFKVTGVVKNAPTNSSIQFDYLLPFQVFFDQNKSWIDQWGSNNIRTFLMLRKDADVKAFGEKLKGEVKIHNEESNVSLFVQPLADFYLYGNFENGQQVGGRIENVRIFFMVALFVLSIACINFTNLSTAQATRRAKEVGLRKVIGAVPSQLFKQFMGESFITVLLSAMIALLLALLLLPFFNELTAKTLSLDLLDLRVVLIFAGILFFTAFLSGIYPSFFIADFKPVEVLKGQLKSGNRAAFFRKALVVVQFTLAIFLIISTTVVFRQMRFMQNSDIGFERDNVFYVWMESPVVTKFETFRSRLVSQEGIESVTAASQLPIAVGNSTSSLNWEGKNEEDDILFSNLNVDYDFVETMKMKMVEGRSYDRNLVTDSGNYIVNEKAAEKFGFTNGTAGHDLTMWEKKGKIIGVVKDFNFGSLHADIEPLVLRIDTANISCLLVRAKAAQTEQAIKSVEKLWKEYAPGFPFKYSFLNEDWDNFYKAEAQQGKVFNSLALLSIFISCLGLFGLSAFSAERRTKELGIRKVLGATVPRLIGLMSAEFAILVLISAVIGCPMGWFAMTWWLEEFAFHIDVGVLTLLIAAGVCLIVAIGTVSYHSLRVASFNPAKSLRYE